VSLGQAVHLIQLVQRIPPSVVRFEDYRESLREEMQNLRLAVRMGRLSEELIAQTRQSLQILDPELKRRFEEQAARARGETGATAAEVQAQIEQDRTLSPPPGRPAGGAGIPLPARGGGPAAGYAARPVSRRPFVRATGPVGRPRIARMTQQCRSPI